MKKKTTVLEEPDFAKIIKQEQVERAAIVEQEKVERANAREAKIAEEESAFMRKYMKDHRRFLSIVSKKSKEISPMFVELLHSQATSTIDTLDSLTQGFDEDGREEVRLYLSRKNTSWPINIASKSEAYITNKVSHIFDDLELGKESVLNVETFKDGGGDISTAAKIIVRRFICAIIKCQIRARIDPDKPRSEMECLAVALGELGSHNAQRLFAVIFEWIMHYGKWYENQETVSTQQLKILRADISILGVNAEKMGNLSGREYRCNSTVSREVRKNLWRAFLQCIKPSMFEGLGTRVMKKGKWVSRSPSVPSMVQHREAIKQLSEG